MADISQIKLPNGDTFDLVDEKSGYLTADEIPFEKVYIFNGPNYETGDSTNITSDIWGSESISYKHWYGAEKIALVCLADGDGGIDGLELYVMYMDNYTLQMIQLDGNKYFRSKHVINDKLGWDSPTVVYYVGDKENAYLTTETDPVFSASAAAGISATDISNWNGKVSDDKTWNGVTLNKSATPTASDTYYIPSMSSIFDTEAKLLTAITTPTARKIPLYDSNSYLYSTTPSANDNSTKVATTAYVDSTVPKIHIIDLAYEDTIDDKSIYNSGDFTNQMIKGYIDNNEIVILKMYKQFYYFDAYDRGVSDLTFVAQNFGDIGKDVLTPYKESGGAYSNKWRAFASDLPIYDGTVE